MTPAELDQTVAILGDLDRDQSQAFLRDVGLRLVAEVRRLHEVERRHDALYAHFADVHHALGEWDDKEFTAAGSVRRMVVNIERLTAALRDALVQLREDEGHDPDPQRAKAIIREALK